MRLPRVLRTTSFRLTLLYAGLFCASVLLLFGAMFWFGTGYVAGQIDKTVSNEIAEINLNAAGRGFEGLRSVVASYSQHAPPGVYYLLLDASGRTRAGNIPTLDPILGVRNWPSRKNGGHFPRARHGVRGLGVRAASDSYLFVGLDSFELGEMREMVARAFIWGLLGTILLALGGGMLMSLGLLRHVETISQTSRDIIAGDLSRRIPVRGSNDEFDHLGASLNAMLDRIEGLMDGLRQVSSDIAHDLRTPLTRLRQRLELARRRGHSVAELHGALDGSINDVDAILDTFAALLRIAQIEAHTKAAGFTSLDLSKMLGDMAETYQSVAEESGYVLTGEIAPRLFIVGDRELLPQLFSNLIENALRHSPKGSRIDVQANVVPEGAEVLIADNGPGIPLDMREKVFQRFFRLERSRTTEGTGLGLSLAGAISAQHGARIELSDNHPGLRVRLIFPAPNKTV